MSTLRATNIKNPDSGSNNIVLDGSGGVVISGVTTVSNANITGGSITGISTVGVTTVTTTNLTVNGNAYPTAGPLSNRNLIINGAMNVAQRGTSETITSNGFSYPCADRFVIEVGGQTSPNYTYTQSGDAPVGFTSSFKITNDSPAVQGSSGTLYNLIAQKVEQYSADCLGWGTSGAKPVTISFWIKSNVTGNDVVELVIRRSGPTGTDSVAEQITINSADTWEYKTVTFPATTTDIGRPGSNALAFALYFSLQGLVGGAKLSSYGTWQNGNYLGGPAGDTNVFASTTGAYMNITGVQLEVGEVATPFEHRSYGDELARCQRYYYKINSATNSGAYQRYALVTCETTTQAEAFFVHPVTMRANPTLGTTAVAGFHIFTENATRELTSMVIDQSSTMTTGVALSVNSGLTAGSVGLLNSNNNNTSYIEFIAEI